MLDSHHAREFAVHPDLLQLVQRTSSEEYSKSMTALATESPDRGRRLTQRRIDLFLTDHSGQVTIACRSGCSFCCHLRVVTTAPEVFGVVEFLRSNLTSDEFSAFRQRVDAAVDRIEPMSRAEHIHTNVQCPVLVDGRCSAYSVRPMMCRSYHSVDLNACKSAFDNPLSDEPMGFSMVRKTVGEHHIAAWRNALHFSGYDPNDYELFRALQEAMASDEAKQRFENKDHAFTFDPEAPSADG